LPPPSPPFSLDDYLVASCGLSPDQARKASKKALTEASREAGRPLRDLSCSRLNSASNPDAVLALLSGVGLARADIAAIVNAYPLILRCSVSIIGPRLLALRDLLGLSATQIACFLLVGSPAFCSRDVAPNFEFFISFYGSFRGLLAAVKRNNSILVADLERVIKPNIEQFLQCGLSVRDIVHVCSVNPRVLSYNPERVKEFVLRADELGVPRSSPMFKYAVAAVTYTGKEKVAAKLEVLKGTLGCSDTEVATAVSRMPSLLGISEEHFRHKIRFLVNRVGMEPRYIVERPVLLGFSLEKRLVPRQMVELRLALWQLSIVQAFWIHGFSNRSTTDIWLLIIQSDNVLSCAVAKLLHARNTYFSPFNEDVAA
ncbi:hypothetical protein EJB05_45617, partial [Eragrostis curvula]